MLHTRSVTWHLWRDRCKPLRTRDIWQVTGNTCDTTYLWHEMQRATHDETLICNTTWCMSHMRWVMWVWCDILLWEDVRWDCHVRCPIRHGGTLQVCHILHRLFLTQESRYKNRIHIAVTNPLLKDTALTPSTIHLCHGRTSPFLKRNLSFIAVLVCC